MSDSRILAAVYKSAAATDWDMNYEEQALILLRRIVRAIDVHAKQLGRASGLTAPQLILLQTLDEEGDITVGQLAKAMNLTQATVTSILDRLGKKQLVQRVRSQKDKRRVVVSLTDQGYELLEQAPAPLQMMFSKQFQDLRGWEQSMVVASLERVAWMLDAEHLDAAPMLEVGAIDRVSEEEHHLTKERDSHHSL